MPISSNRRQRIINFATPKVADLVVVERIDASKNLSSADAADAAADEDGNFGAAHPDATKFPNFKLSLIKDGQDEQGQFQLWYYVKDRANQDDYNWEFQAAGASNPHYDTVVRTYVLARFGSGAGGGLVEGEEFAGIHVFDEDLPLLTSSMPTSTFDPFGDGLGGNDPDESYILFEKKQVRSGDETLDSLFVVEQRVYVKRVPMWRVDTDPEFPAYDSLVTKETLWYVGENPKASVTFATNETLVTPTAVLTTPALFANADAEIPVQTSMFPGGERPDGSALPTNTNFWGVDEHGIMREGKQLTDNWYAIIEKQVVAAVGELSNITTHQNYSWPAVLDGTTTSMTSEELSNTGGTEAGAAGDNKGGIVIHSWERQTGGHDTVATPIFKRQSWSGPTQMSIQRTWQKTPFTIPKVKPMLPEPVNFVTPIFTLKVGACLHTRIHVYATSGTDHEVYEYAGAAFTFDRTNYEDWPTSLVVSDTQTSFRGGYLREITTAYHPDVSNVDP